MMLVVVVVIETAPPEHSGEVGTSEDHLKNEKLQIMQIHLVRYSTSVRVGKKSSNNHLVRIYSISVNVKKMCI